MRRAIRILFFLFLLTISEKTMAQEHKTAVVAGGCFWCIEHDLQPVEGVLDVESGYAGGDLENPRYEDVSSGDSGHIESVRVTYDPEVISYEELLRQFWMKVDPHDAGGQFCDRGLQYRSAVFVMDKGERQTAEALRTELEGTLRQPIETEVIDYKNFYPAEEYHQNYAEKNPVRYKFYRWNCGRDQRVKEVWGK